MSSLVKLICVNISCMSECKICQGEISINAWGECKSCCQKRNSEYYQRNREKKLKKQKEHNKNNKKDVLEYAKKYREEHRELIGKKMAAYRRERMKKDSVFRLASLYRTRLYQALKSRSFKKTKCSMRLVGCSWGELRSHLERKFVDGMTWDNYGAWHVDHIIPLASAKTNEEFEKLCHYTNLQPLWAKDNLIKGDKIQPLSESPTQVP